MAITKKTKMGNMVGVNPKEITRPAEVSIPEKTEEQVLPVIHSDVALKHNGRPKYELIKGEKEKNINVKIPVSLWKFIDCEAHQQEITVKQFVCEIIMKVMIDDYGFNPTE